MMTLDYLFAHLTIRLLKQKLWMIIFHLRVKDVNSATVKKRPLRLGHNFIGTEHLMLGILRDGGGKAIAILNAIEVNLKELRRKVEILNPAAVEDTPY